MLLRSPAKEKLVDWQLQLLLLWIHHHVCTEIKLPLGCSQPLTNMVGILVACGTPLTEESSKLLLEDSPLPGLKLSWNYNVVLDSSSPVLLPSFFSSGSSSQWEALAEIWRLGGKEGQGSFSASCDTSSSIYLCLLHVYISLHIIHPFPLWSSPLQPPPTEPLAPSNDHCNQTISIGLGIDKYTNSSRKFRKRF